VSVTLSITDALRYVSTLLDNQLLSVNQLDPGITCANIVLQRMLGAPFIWRFNRGNLPVAIAANAGTDFTVACSDLGRIETQWLTDAGGIIFELKGAQTIAKRGSNIGPTRPTAAAPVYDDNCGNITFRVNSIADVAYTAFFDYQKKAPKLESYGQTFGPVPDEFGYLFNKGLLAECALLTNDSRFPIWERDFMAGMLATQDGLDAQDIQIFLGQTLGAGRTAQRSTSLGQSGAQARTVA
jgi:hypothetical protein